MFASIRSICRYDAAMWRLFPLAVITGVCTSCSASTCPQALSTPDTTPPVAQPAAVAEQPTAGPDISGAVTFEADTSTPAGVREQFGRFVGVWRCQGETRQPDGTFKPGPGGARWTFFYTLGGQAIGDVYEPPQGSGPVGINLRVYRPETNDWVLSWTTPKLQRYDHFEARQEGETLVMRGEIAAKAPFPQHQAKITFHDIHEDTFEWRYEAAAPGTDGPWQEFSRIHCRADRL